MPQSSAPSVIDALVWVHVRDGRVLCVLPERSDLLYSPGGKREPGESDEEGVAREALEEVGVRLVPGTFRLVTVFEEAAHGRPPGTLVRMTCYTADHEGEPAASAEIRELAWISHGERHRCAPATRRLVEILHERGMVS
ncbi:NUDIX hydrolase [Nocardiopsis algeriensis]|uniref:8-oxo-dGTP pyrophosphatase MutT (NUDIX family) n=1 Tax=Nocardiopsis algeriensis TaxID=1478215 RepID=A0A841IHJ5_9ACTN|nr:NUDIX domain-containing protein [Nocardiopsis algeriensis]MBB6118209.1 8-oxo-dGTP pyrophosphatase MutT (NUDIX family) [Nocardiopsis algeriensis]